jgi:multiple sugar transport system permease protein/putative aldouronate transport system permease protein
MSETTIAGKKRLSFNPLEVVNILILSLFAFMCVYPLFYIFINSLSSARAIAQGVFLIPREFSLEAYNRLANVAGIWSSIGVSVARTVIGSVFTAFCSSFVAYIITRKRMPFRKIIYRFFVFTMYINAGFIPYYLVISKLGLRNNFLVYILPYAVAAYYIILVKTYIESIPNAIWESAEIDGAGILLIYGKLIVPLIMPIVACIIVFAAVNQWNTWSDDMFFMMGSKGRNLHVLQYVLYRNLQSTTVQGNSASAGVGMEISPTTLRMAMTFITVLPILCVYPFMQRFFTKGIMLGAVKG